METNLYEYLCSKVCRMNKKTGSKLEFLVAVIDENLSHSFVCVWARKEAGVGRASCLIFKVTFTT